MYLSCNNLRLSSHFVQTSTNPRRHSASLPLTVLSALLPNLLLDHQLVVWMCRCLYHCRYLLVQEVQVCALPVALLVAVGPSFCQPQRHWPLAVLEALSVPALAEEVEALVSRSLLPSMLTGPSLMPSRPFVSRATILSSH